MRISNFKCRDSVRERKSFTASNLHGEYIGGYYVVFSYGWYPLWAHINEQWYGHKERYSRSTSKHRSQSCPFGDIIEFETMKELKDKIYEQSGPIQIVRC